jgi:hypothetical protein
VSAHVLAGEQRFALANGMPPSGRAPKNLLGHASPGHAPAREVEARRSLRERNGKANLQLPEIDADLTSKFSAYFYKLTLPAGTFKQRGHFKPAVD